MNTTEAAGAAVTASIGGDVSAFLPVADVSDLVMAYAKCKVVFTCIIETDSTEYQFSRFHTGKTLVKLFRSGIFGEREHQKSSVKDDRDLMLYIIGITGEIGREYRVAAWLGSYSQKARSNCDWFTYQDETSGDAVQCFDAALDPFLVFDAWDSRRIRSNLKRHLEIDTEPPSLTKRVTFVQVPHARPLLVPRALVVAIEYPNGRDLAVVREHEGVRCYTLLNGVNSISKIFISSAVLITELREGCGYGGEEDLQSVTFDVDFFVPGFEPAIMPKSVSSLDLEEIAASLDASMQAMFCMIAKGFKFFPE